MNQTRSALHRYHIRQMVMSGLATACKEFLRERYYDLVGRIRRCCLLRLVTGDVPIVRQLCVRLIRHHGRAFIHGLKLMHCFDTSAVRQVEVEMDGWLIA